MLKTCKVCGQTKETTHENWVFQYEKPTGRTCRACKNEKQQAIRNTKEGRAVATAASVKYNTERYKHDAQFRLRLRLGQETNRLLKELAEGKGTDYMSLKIFGADRATVFAHIDAQLQTRGFKWENHGTEWQLDHRTPLAMAQSSIELYQLCLLENTQVLTPEENRAKAIEDARLIRQHEA